jgi:hypothetical protein
MPNYRKSDAWQEGAPVFQTADTVLASLWEPLLKPAPGRRFSYSTFFVIAIFIRPTGKQFLLFNQHCFHALTRGNAPFERDRNRVMRADRGRALFVFNGNARGWFNGCRGRRASAVEARGRRVNEKSAARADHFQCRSCERR